MEEMSMKATRVPNEIESRAAQALDALLHQVSSIHTRDIRFEPAGSRCNLSANIDVFGRHHRLVCGVSDGEPEHVRQQLTRLRRCAASRKDHPMQVLIAPSLSPQVQALCEQQKVAFLDLTGNARFEVGEVLISRRAASRTNGVH
jgi:hypothetical protein